MQNAERFWDLHSHKSLKPPKTVELLNTYLQVFSELELVPLPLKESRTGKLIPMFQWGEVKSVDDAKKLLSQMSIDDARKIRGFAIRTGSSSKAIVLDVDDEEKFSKWASEVLGIGLEDLQRLADWTVKTKSNGWHFWFRVDEETAKAFKTVQKQDLGFDLRGENGLCNIVAWDRGDGQLYQLAGFGSAKEEEKTTFLRDLYGVLYTSKEEVPKVEKQVQSELGKALREAYENGELNGWAIEAGLSTLLVKWGYSDEQIHKLFQEVYGDSYDYHRTQYIIQRTREKDYGINREFLDYLRAKGLLRRKAQKPAEWLVDGDYIHRLSKSGDIVLTLRKVDVLAQVNVEGRLGLLLKVGNKESLLWINARKEEYENIMERPLEHKAFEAYKAYFRHILDTQEVPIWKLYTSLGWDKEDWTFKHPLIVGSEKFMSKNPQIELLLESSKEAMRSSKWMENNEEFMAFLKEQIRSATGFSVLYTLGLASLFISIISGCMPFTVIVSGISGAGKTTACQMVQNSFLPLEISSTVNTTQNALELTLSRLSNMPVLFDELKLSKLDTEDIVFMTASGKGKARATADLSVKVRDLRSVVFLTTEVMPEFERQGAIRRVLILHVDSRQDLFGTHANNLPYSIRRAWGHGIPFARALMEDRELIYTLWDKAEAWLKEKNFQFFEFQHIALPCIASTFLMEHVLEEDMEVVRERIYALIEEQYAEFEKHEKDVAELLTEWLLLNEFRFYRTRTRRSFNGEEYLQELPPRAEAWGRIDEDVVLMTSTAFKEFTKFCKKTQRKLVEELKSRGILIPAPNGDTMQTRSINSRPTKVYVLRIPAVLGEHTVENGDGRDTGRVERVENQDKQVVMEEFLTSAGFEPEDIEEVVKFAMQFMGVSWERQGNKLRWIVDGVEVEDMDLSLEELKRMHKEEAKELVLTMIERIAEIEPATASRHDGDEDDDFFDF